MIIMPIHHTTEREPTEKEEINIASLQHSNDEEKRKSFRDGADWFNEKFCDSSIKTPGDFLARVLGSVFIVFFIVNVFALVGGVMKAVDSYGKYSCKLENRWAYVAISYYPTCELVSWLNGPRGE